MKSLIISLLFIFGSSHVFAQQHSKNWSYSVTENGITVELTISACYPEEEKQQIAFRWSKDDVGYNSTSINITCGCGEALVLDDKTTVKVDNLSSIIKNGVPVTFKKHQCVAVDKKKADALDSHSNLSGR